MELIGIRRARGRDLATGIVLGFGLGLAALFLYLGTTENTRRPCPDPVRHVV
jgi:zinc/manganese transport system permease protein